MRKTVVISELGINHNGDVEIAKKLIALSKEYGCNAVKFQKRTISKVYSQEELDRPRESPWGLTNKHQKLGLEFEKPQYDEIDKYCKEINIEWFASPWDLESLFFLDQYNLKYMKLASALLLHEELIIQMARRGKYTFISTGMSTLEEISNVVKIFKDLNCPFELMHCNSQYPMPDDEANLRMIKVLRDMFQCKVGYSCHSSGVLIPSLAVFMGATSIEKHITLDRAMYGSDQSASLEPQGLKRMIDYIEIAEKAMGDGRKIISEGEEKCRKKLQRIKDY